MAKKGSVMDINNKNFTFIHSAWMGGWQWQSVGKELNSSGYDFNAPDLPGHGEKNGDNPAHISLNDYVKTITDILDQNQGKTILVGHSFGGVVASQVAEARPDKIEAIVYLCAFMLPDGVSFLDATQNVKTSEVLNNLVFSEDKTTVSISEDALHNAVAADVPGDAFQAAKPFLVPEPTAPFGEKLSLSKERYGKIPRYYVECTKDNAIPVNIQRAMVKNQPVEYVFSLDASHAPVFSMPDQVVRVLKEIAQFESLREAVQTASKSWQKAFNSGDAKKSTATHYLPDAIMVAKPFGTYHGHTDIQAFWEDIIKKGFSDIEYINPKITFIDSKTARLESDWRMNLAKGIITNETWVMQEDHFEVQK